jgi:hypothetical protein
MAEEVVSWPENRKSLICDIQMRLKNGSMRGAAGVDFSPNVDVYVPKARSIMVLVCARSVTFTFPCFRCISYRFSSSSER